MGSHKPHLFHWLLRPQQAEQRRRRRQMVHLMLLPKSQLLLSFFWHFSTPVEHAAESS